MGKRNPVIALFGLSANPPTGLGGHAGMVRWIATRTDLGGIGSVQEVWILPVYIHAYESKREMPSFEHRMRMAELAFESLPDLFAKVRIMDTERRVAEGMMADLPHGQLGSIRVGTVDVVRFLQQEHPDKDFTLLLGGDTYRDLQAGRWKESKALLSMIPVVVVPRQGIGPEPDAPEDAPTLEQLSSTDVRKTKDLDYLRSVLQPKVLEYIRSNRLYAFAD